MRHFALVCLAGCGTSAELGKPNDPPQWPLGTELHRGTTPEVQEAPAAGVPADPDASAAPASEVTEPPGPTPADATAPAEAEEPVVQEPPEGQ